MTRADEMISLFQTFDPVGDTSGQGWSDVGFDCCREAFDKFNKADWFEFEARKNELSNEQRLLLADLTPLLPEQHRLSLLVWLVSHADGESWVASAEVLGEWFSRASEAVTTSRDLVNPRVAKKFEEQLLCFINFPQTTQTFDEYLARYSHLVTEGVVELYAWLRGSHNNPLQPIAREDAHFG